MNGKVMREQIESTIKDIEMGKERLEILAKKLYKKEKGKELVGGYKAGLRDLGFVV